MEQQKVDLDALEAALANATLEEDNAERVEADTDAIIAFHNALSALIAELRELRARVTPEPISDKHKDGNWWLVWEPGWEHWCKVRWRYEGWHTGGGALFVGDPTHALPLPPALEAKP